MLVSWGGSIAYGERVILYLFVLLLVHSRRAPERAVSIAARCAGLCALFLFA
jgi:hypothetical protein